MAKKRKEPKELSIKEKPTIPTKTTKKLLNPNPFDIRIRVDGQVLILPPKGIIEVNSNSQIQTFGNHSIMEVK